jgi:hypothetical protein
MQNSVEWLQKLSTARILALRKKHSRSLYGGGWIEVRGIKIELEDFKSVLSNREHLSKQINISKK